MSRRVSRETVGLLVLGLAVATLLVAVEACRPEPAPPPPPLPVPTPVAFDGPLDELKVDVWSAPDGLPQNTITALAQTPDGYLWIGSQEGVARFNGATFLTFDQGTDAAFQPSESIERLTPAPDGALLVATLGGLARIEGDRAERLHAGAFGAANVQEVVVGADSALWVATTEGLFRCADACARVAGGRVQALARTPDGTIWAGVGADLLRIGGGRTARLPMGADVLVVEPARDGGVWVAGAEGVRHVRPDTVLEAVPGVPAEPVFALAEDVAGALWLGTADGIVRVAQGRAERLGADRGLVGRVGALLFDREGTLWAGTSGGGLVRLHEAAFAMRVPTGSAVVLTVHEDPGGRLWAGTDDGVLHRADGDALAPAHRFAHPVSAVAGQGGALWVGTLGGGLHVRRGGEWSAVGGLPSPVVTALHVGSSGTLWAGTDAGVVRLGPTPEVLDTRAGLPSNVVTAVLEAADGALWVGTYDAGLAVRRDGRWATLGADVLGTSVVAALYEDADRTLWVGTFGGGLVRFPSGDTARAARLTPRHGLHDDKVYQILEDGAGGLWMGSNNGISRVPRAELAAVAEGRQPRVEALVYDEDDGLATREINGGTQPAGWASADGRLWFPTPSGLAVVHPAALRAARPAPPVVVEAMRADGARVPLGASLAPGTERVEFDFAALALTDPTAVRYRYRLDGYETVWTAPETGRTATYTHLDPGRYTFRVIARNEDGVWNESGAAVTFTLRAHLWQTPWFWLVVGLALAGAAVAAYRWRVRSLTEQRRRLERDVADRTRDLRQALGEKEVLLREVHHRVKNNLQIVASLLALQSRKTTDAAARDLLADARSRVVSMAGVHERLYRADALASVDGAAYVRAVVEEQFALFNVSDRITLVVDADDAPITPDQAVPLGLVANELVSNALKHAFPTGEGRLTVSLRRAGDRLRFAVEDDGPGLPPGGPSSAGSLGMLLVRSFADRLGGTLTVGPAVGAPSGARFDVDFPVTALTLAEAVPA